MIREDPILRDLPSEFLNDPFWSKSHVPRPSTFGASGKQTFVKVDDRFTLKNGAQQWVQQDDHGNHHGRVQIVDYWGKYHDSPPPGSYNPDHEKLSKREIGPKHTIPRRYHDSYFEDLDYSKKNPIKQLHSPQDVFSAKNVLTVSHKEATKSELHRINVEDMRKSLLPGPGSYDANIDHVVKFERTPVLPMNPRQRTTKPRAIVDLDNAMIIKDRLKKNDKTYDANFSAVLKNNPAYTLGVPRALLNQREYPPTGPGDYNDDKIFRIGQPVRVTTGAVKRK